MKCLLTEIVWGFDLVSGANLFPIRDLNIVKQYFNKAKQYIGNSIEESFVERFDEVFLCMIDDALARIN